MTDAAIAAKTGRTWRQWVDALDADGAASMTHRDIAAMVHAKHHVGDWWAQTVTVGYERVKGLRERGQRRNGTVQKRPRAGPTTCRWRRCSTRGRTTRRDAAGSMVSSHSSARQPSRSRCACDGPMARLSPWGSRRKVGARAPSRSRTCSFAIGRRQHNQRPTGQNGSMRSARS